MCVFSCLCRIPLLWLSSPASYNGSDSDAHNHDTDAHRPVEESGTPAERVLYHVIMMLVSATINLRELILSAHLSHINVHLFGLHITVQYFIYVLLFSHRCPAMVR